MCRPMPRPERGDRAPGVAATVRAIVALELRLHARDFMAWLGALVFFFLAFAHAAGGPITLVSGTLADLPRTAPPVLAQAMAGLTAFGQVITAMTAATIGLRDVSLRSDGLVLTTGIDWRHYLLGRYAATLVVLLLITAAMPLGFALGGAVGVLRGVSEVGVSLASIALPLLTLVLPNVVLVAAAFFAAASLNGTFSVILFVGLGFVGLWQTGLGLVARGHAIGALVDPFGNAALTAGHSLGANRALWLAVTAALIVFTLWRWRPRLAGGAEPRRQEEVVRAPSAARIAPATGLPALRGASATAQWNAEYRFGLHWVLRERGFAVLLLLAVLNAAANGWSVANDPDALVRALEFHARLFAILIATIYAGELVWRDRDVRAQELLDALPVRRDLRLLARSTGVLSVLLALPLSLPVVALLLSSVRGGTLTAPCAFVWLGGVGGLLFMALFGLSLAVHRVVLHKTAAHLLLIAAWVTAIAAGADALARPWLAWGHCGP